MNVIGIDPGKSGAVAVVDETRTEVELYRFSKGDNSTFWRFLALHEGSPAFVEKVHASPQMGVTSSFKFGKSFGSIEMAVIAAGLEVEFVTPQKWQKAIGLKTIGGGFGASDTEKKNRNKELAQKLFPAIKVTHAIADALLIAEYGLQENGWVKEVV